MTNDNMYTAIFKARADDDAHRLAPRFIGVWQQESGKGRLANGAAKLRSLDCLVEFVQTVFVFTLQEHNTAPPPNL